MASRRQKSIRKRMHFSNKFPFCLFSQYKYGAIQVLHNIMEGGEVYRSAQISKGARSNVINVTRGWVGVKFAEKSVM